MTRVVDDPDAFAAGALAGFSAAYGDYVVPVAGGFVRAGASPHGQTAVVIGGGSGHYPAFAGLVGTGLATGAACGNVFASPSAGQVYRVARAADNGGGILFSYGNYAGDCMQFGQAQQRLRAAGIDARTVLVTDDIASAPPEQGAERRGIAGGLAVFKVAGAAAQSGLGLDEVERLARKANSHARTLGVAFGGCTLPGADGPLFSVPTGKMSIGLGIHGEPGISDVTMPSAADLATLLVGRLLQDRPGQDGEKVVVLVNGLGTVKYEELFLLYGHVPALLGQAGIQVADVECGEMVTSLDMSGLSLTLFWVDQELELLWGAPADSPAFRKMPRLVGVRRQVSDEAGAAALVHEEATAASRRLAELATALLATVAETLRAHQQDLGDLDAVAGDGDHGTGMSRGAQGALAAARAALGQAAGVRALLLSAGEEWSEKAGGSSGALWGTALIAGAASLGNRENYGAADLVGLATAGRDAMVALGGAQTGDKTIIDAANPFVEVLRAGAAQGLGAGAAFRAAAEASTRAAAETASLMPRKGRARPLAERSRGHADPGATSFALMMSALVAQAQQGPGVKAELEQPRGQLS